MHPVTEARLYLLQRASAMVLAGGLIDGGRVLGDWPGLGEGRLFEDRDLMPTGDIRRYVGWVLKGLYGVSDTALTARIFPGVELGSDPRILKL